MEALRLAVLVSLAASVMSLSLSTLSGKAPPRLKGSLPEVLPDIMRSDVQGTWAFDTMSRRVVEDILPRIIKDNTDELNRPSSPKRAECFLQLNDLIASLKCGESGFLRGIADSGPDVEIWDSILREVPESERNWLNAPWVVAEFYLYRRIAEAFRYFETGYDMFSAQKVAGLVEAMPSIEEIARRQPALMASESKEVVVTLAVLTSLWGNKVDLSLWPAAEAQVTREGEAAIDNKGRILFGDAIAANEKYILDDKTDEAVAILCSSEGSVVDIIVGAYT